MKLLDLERCAALGALVLTLALPRAAFACDSDNECKGNRICTDHRCVSPDSAPSASPPAPAPATAPAPEPTASDSPPPPPPPPPRSWAYFDAGLTAGLPLFFGTGENSTAGVGFGGGVHLDGGIKVSDHFGLGADFGLSGFGYSSGGASGVLRIDLGAVWDEYRVGLGVALLGNDLGASIYIARFWHITGPFWAGLSFDEMFDFGASIEWFVIGGEIGVQFGDR